MFEETDSMLNNVFFISKRKQSFIYIVFYVNSALTIVPQLRTRVFCKERLAF
jgi:hypothetical protein